MKITPFKVRFKLDPGTVKNKYGYGKPSEEPMALSLGEDGVYTVQTHDRGNTDQDPRYYQIVFRIEDPSPFTLEELSLHLDSAIYRNSGMQINNDLYCDPETRLDPKKNLWYQQTTYRADGTIVNEEDNKSPQNAIFVDSITSSGVFRIVVKRNDIILDQNQYQQPWIYVLPSSVTKDDYLCMLDDLIRLNKELVLNEKHATGFGGEEKNNSDRETNIINIENANMSELFNLTQKVMRLSSELVGKRYIKTRLEKIHHFDGHVIRDYIRNGMTGKTTGVEYFENHDTYENRVLKYVLSRLCQRSSYIYDKDDIKLDIDKAQETIYQKLTESIEVKKHEQETKRLSFVGTQPNQSSGYKLRIEVDRNIVRMQGHHAFSQEGGNRYNKLILFANSRAELIFYLQKLIACYDEINNGEVPTFNITCKIVNEDKNQNISIFTISDCENINDDVFVNAYVSDDEYRRQLNDMCSTLEFVTIINNSFELISPHIQKIAPKRSSEEEKRIKEEIVVDLINRQERAKACFEDERIRNQIKSLLKDPWFTDIKQINDLQELRLTPKFRFHSIYSKIYRLLRREVEFNPVIEASFDRNAFGVNSTQRVYEYWVFYKILDYFSSVGFKLNDEQRKELKLHFRNFIDNKQPSRKYSGYEAEIRSNSFVINIGYDISFSAIINERKKEKRPDYYIRIQDSNVNHWYFIDAKYNSFTRSGQNSYLKKIYDVAISGYIHDMKEILSSHEIFGNQTNNINGSYITMAACNEEQTPLSDNDRLFGGKESIFKLLKNYQNEGVPLSIDNDNGFPEHRYGGIVLTPSHDNEFKSLMWLIFEYLESDRSDDAERNQNLNYCWRCGDKVDRERIEINNNTDRYKYYATCRNPKCKAFRVDNHCISCGSLIIKHKDDNYHKWDDSVKDNPKWAFLCPVCGVGVKGILKEEFDRKKATSTSYDNYEEAPPLTDEQLFAIVPPRNS